MDLFEWPTSGDLRRLAFKRGRYADKKPLFDDPNPNHGIQNPCSHCHATRVRYFRLVKTHSRGGEWVSRCKQCESARSRVQAKKPDQMERNRARARVRYAKDKDYFKNYWTAERRRARALGEYGLTLEDYRSMHEAQGGKCMVCGEHETAVRRGKILPLSVDHDHSKSGRSAVRGLLCHKCNSGIAHFERVEGWSDKVLAYLARFK